MPSAPPEDLDTAIARLHVEGLHTRDIAVVMPRLTRPSESAWVLNRCG